MFLDSLTNEEMNEADFLMTPVSGNVIPFRAEEESLVSNCDVLEPSYLTINHQLVEVHVVLCVS